MKAAHSWAGRSDMSSRKYELWPDMYTEGTRYPAGFTSILILTDRNLSPGKYMWGSALRADKLGDWRQGCASDGGRGKGGGLGSDELGVEFPGTTVGEKRQLLGRRGSETSTDRETSADGKR